MLAQFLTAELFAFLLIFCRVGSAVMLLPGFGEAYVSPRVRLMLALMISLVMAAAHPRMPPVPSTTAVLVTLIGSEILIGLFLGGLSRILISAAHIAGTIIALQSSLASALIQDVTQVQGQATLISNLLGMAALVLIFILDLHHMMLAGLLDSYTLFTVGNLPPVGDMANHATQLMNSAFAAAMRLAAPHLAVGLILYVGAGVIARLVPSIQVFFLLMPPQIMICIYVLMVCFGAMMMAYMTYFQEGLAAFLAPGT